MIGDTISENILAASADDSAARSLKAGDIDDAGIVLMNIYSRRSVRSYLHKDVPDEVIREIIKAGTYAPTAVNKQPWRFVVIKNRDFIEQYGELARKLWLENNKDPKDEHLIEMARMMAYENFKVFYGAPALILVFAHPDAFSPYQDCSLAAENMMLAARALGLGSCWIGLATLLGSDERFLKEMGVSKNYRLIAPLIFGYPKKADIKGPDRNGDVILKWVDGASRHL
jgi:nitroreductase